MDKLIRNSTAEFLIFTSSSKEEGIEVKVFEDSVWLTQNMIAQLFDTTKQNVSLHIKNIFKGGELEKVSVVKDFLTTAKDGKLQN